MAVCSRSEETKFRLGGRTDRPFQVCARAEVTGMIGALLSDRELKERIALGLSSELV